MFRREVGPPLWARRACLSTWAAQPWCWGGRWRGSCALPRATLRGFSRDAAACICRRMPTLRAGPPHAVKKKVQRSLVVPVGWHGPPTLPFCPLVRLARWGSNSSHQPLRRCCLFTCLAPLPAHPLLWQVGVFTGYSSIAMAQALPPGGRLVACDRDPKSLALAREYWQKAGVADKVGGRGDRGRFGIPHSSARLARGCWEKAGLAGEVL